MDLLLEAMTQEALKETDVEIRRNHTDIINDQTGNNLRFFCSAILLSIELALFSLLVRSGKIYRHTDVIDNHRVDELELRCCGNEQWHSL